MDPAPISAVGRAVLRVPDLDAALAFYGDLLGFVVLHDQTAGGFRYLHVGVPAQDGVGVWLMPGEGAGDGPALVLYADDRDAVAERLDAAGAEVWAVTEDSGSRSLHTRDPGGNVLVVAQLVQERGA